jgi:two-component system chemotaxis sensor kinase CheA
MSNDLMQYLDLFESEARDYIQDLNTYLIKVEKNPKDTELLNTLMRIAHTLKGITATMKFNKISALCHAMEDFFDAARQNKFDLNSQIIDLLFEAIDVLEDSIKKVSSKKEEPDLSGIQNKLREVFKKTDGKTAESKIKKSNNLEKPINNRSDINIVKKKSLKKDDSNRGNFSPKEFEHEQIKDIKVNVKTLDSMMNLMGELITLKMRFKELYKKKQYNKFPIELDKFERLAQELQYNIMKARMVKVSYLFNRFPRMVRDLARRENKNIEIKMEGGDIEFDRTIIDKLDEPLVHLIKNAVGHGIEKEGTIYLKARREKNYSVIEVADNGAGIDPEKIKKRAIEKKLITEEEAKKLNKEQAIAFIFDPLLSTSEKVSDVSGRGVGLSAVKKKMEDLGGNIYVESVLGKGTRFILELALTLASIKALLVRVNNCLYAFPLMHVERSVDMDQSFIKKAFDSNIAIINGEDIPLLDLDYYFNTQNHKCPLSEHAVKNKKIVIVSKDSNKFGFLVDEVIMEEEIIVKPLTGFLKDTKEFAGVTILGDGRIALIVDIKNIF